MKKTALIFGIFFLLLGGFGMMPELVQNGRLFGIFQVDAALNLVHLITGLLGLVVAAISSHASQIYLKIVGVVYALLAIAWFFAGGRPLFGVLANNGADAWLHAGIALVALYLGLGCKVQPHINGAAPSERL